MAGWCISRKHKQTVNSCVCVCVRVECCFIGNTSLAPDGPCTHVFEMIFFTKSLMHLTAFVLKSWCMSSSVPLCALLWYIWRKPIQTLMYTHNSTNWPPDLDCMTSVYSSYCFTLQCHHVYVFFKVNVCQTTGLVLFFYLNTMSLFTCIISLNIVWFQSLVWILCRTTRAVKCGLG